MSTGSTVEVSALHQSAEYDGHGPPFFFFFRMLNKKNILHIGTIVCNTWELPGRTYHVQSRVGGYTRTRGYSSYTK